MWLNRHTDLSSLSPPAAWNPYKAAECQQGVKGVAGGRREVPPVWQRGRWWGSGRYSCPCGHHREKWQWGRCTWETGFRGYTISMLFTTPAGIHNLFTVREGVEIHPQMAAGLSRPSYCSMTFFFFDSGYISGQLLHERRFYSHIFP